MWRPSARRLDRERRLEREQAELVSAVEARLAEIMAGRVESTTTVARLPTVIAARALIADTAAMLPIVAVRDGLPVTPTPTILVRPDPGMSRRRFVHRWTMSLTGWGNTYVQVLRIGANDWPLAGQVIHPDAISPDLDPMDPTRVVGWSVGTGEAQGVGLDVTEVVHTPLWETELAAVARAPLAECQAAFDDLAIMWAFAAGYWREGGKPPYALRNPSRLSKEQANEALDQWVEARRLRRPGLLTGPWTIEDLAMPTAEDALLLDGLAYIDQQVARIYGITPTLLNIRAETGSLTYSNARDEVVRWLDLSLYPTWLARLEDALTAMLPRGQQALVDTGALTEMGMARPGADNPVTAPPPVGAPPPPLPPPPPPPPPPAAPVPALMGGPADV